MTEAERELFQAASECDPNRLRNALLAEVDVSAADDDGDTALHLIVSQMPNAERDFFLSCLDILLMFGPNVNLSNKLGNTPLHVVIYESNTDNSECRIRALNIAGLLIEHTANVNSRNHEGLMPVHFAFWRQCYGFLDLHTAEGGKIEDSLFVPPFPFIMSGLNGIQRLLSLDLKPRTVAANAIAARYRHFEVDINQRRARREVLAQLLEAGLNSRTELGYRGDRLLHTICRSLTEIDDIRLLMGYRANKDVNKKNKDGDNPLHLYLRRPFDDSFSSPSHAGIQLFKMHGADIDEPDSLGITPRNAIQKRGLNQEDERI